MSPESVPFQRDIDRIVDRLRKSKRVLFITGAGLSADSGLPTYRGVGGLYDSRGTEEGYAIEEVLSGTMFERRPGLTWKYLLEVGMAVLGSKPNRGHEIIAELETCFREHDGAVWTLSQNIDGYHRAAGSKNLLEIHGTMYRWYCTGCEWKTEAPPIEAIHNGMFEMEIPPRCSECGAIVRPDVVLFEEMLPRNVLSVLQSELECGFDLIIAVGTSAMFPYIYSPFAMAKYTDTLTVDINPGESSLADEVDIHLPLGAAKALEYIRERFFNQ